MPARVKGPTENIVIVGAGLAGLSAALHLAGKGRNVRILERESIPGGRNGLLSKSGFNFDTGPTVLTMPSLIEEVFNSVGEKSQDWLELLPVTPLYRAFYHDGTQLDILSDPQQMQEEIAEKISSAEAQGYKRYVEFVTKLYRYEMNDFINRNIDSPLALLTPNLAKLLAIGGFRKLGPKVEEFMKDPKLQKAFSFQSMYAGVSPQQALALYAVIAYMDSVNGVYFPKGGMHALPRALAGAALKHGVKFSYNTTVTQIEHSDGRARAVMTSAGERVPCDAVILTPDLPVAWRELIGTVPRKVRRLKYSPSCVTLLVGSSAQYSHAAHHNIHFGKAWDSVFNELIKKKVTMKDPSFLMTIPTKSDSSLAPTGKSSYYCLFPTPNMSAGIDWIARREEYRDHIIRTLESRGYEHFESSIEIEEMTTPLDWQNRGMEVGAPFASAHTFLQTGPFRPKNIARGFENILFAGSGTLPGVGVPMVLISGRLAAERII